MPFTVLYAENIFGDDSVERRIYGPGVRVILAEPNRSLADIADADCAAADRLLLVTHLIEERDFARFLKLRAICRQGGGYGMIDRKAVGRAAGAGDERSGLRHHRGRRSCNVAGVSARAAAAS